jgi:hypothetical protein
MRKQLAFDAVSCPHVDVTVHEQAQPCRDARRARGRLDDALITMSMAAVTLFGVLMIADVLRYV